MARPATVSFAGAVFSDAGQALPGATVSVQGRAIDPAITNAEGFFLLPLPQGAAVRLVVSYPGHVPQIVDLRSPEAEKNLVITLQSMPTEAAKGGRTKKIKVKRN